MANALLIAFCYWFFQTLDGYMGWQTWTRPIVLAAMTGLICGDFTTGIILGGELEAVYMGVSSIGGEAPSNYQAASVLCVGFVVLSGADQATGLALAVTVGTLINAFKPFTQALALVVHPAFLKMAENAEVKKFRIGMWLQQIFLSQLIPTVVVFAVALGGELGLQKFMEVCPAFILNGLNAASNVLVVVGLCLTTQAIWAGSSTVIYVILGFVMVKFLSLGTLPIAAIGTVIAYAYFVQNNKLNKIQNTQAGAIDTNTGGDDFYD